MFSLFNFGIGFLVLVVILLAGPLRILREYERALPTGVSRSVDT